MIKRVMDVKRAQETVISEEDVKPQVAKRFESEECHDNDLLQLESFLQFQDHVFCRSPEPFHRNIKDGI